MDLAEHKLTVTEDHLYLRKLSLDKMQNQEIKQDKDAKPKVWG